MSDNETRAFHLGDILTITTGRLVSPDHVAGIYKILDWMTGDQLMTHQLPRGMDECSGPLLKQHPDLASVDVPEDLSGEAAVRRWLAEQVAIYDEMRQVARLAPEQHTRIDPLAELAMMRPGMPVIVVKTDPGE